jgi:hypothetical protein
MGAGVVRRDAGCADDGLAMIDWLLHANPGLALLTLVAAVALATAVAGALRLAIAIGVLVVYAFVRLTSDSRPLRSVT